MYSYGDFTQIEIGEGWVCPIAMVGEDVIIHPYGVSTMPGPDGYTYHFSTDSLWKWVSVHHRNPLTREYVPRVVEAKLERRSQLLTEFPDWDKRVSIDITPLFSDPTADRSILYRRVEPSTLSCFFSFDGAAPSSRRKEAKTILDPLPLGSWLIRKGSIKSVEKATGTNTAANSYVLMIKVADGYQNIPFIHFFGYGFRVCFDFSNGTDLTVRAPPLEDVTYWYFTFGDMLTHPDLVGLDLTKAVSL